MSLCLCFASQRGNSPVISFISPRRQLPRRKRFPPTRQIAPDAESARPDTVWKSRAFLTLAADRQCQKKEQSSWDSHKIALPTPTHTSVLLLCTCRRMLVLVDKLSGLLWFQVSGYFAKRAYRLQRRSPTSVVPGRGGGGGQNDSGRSQ